MSDGREGHDGADDGRSQGEDERGHPRDSPAGDKPTATDDTQTRSDADTQTETGTDRFDDLEPAIHHIDGQQDVASTAEPGSRRDLTPEPRTSNEDDHLPHQREIGATRTSDFDQRFGAAQSAIREDPQRIDPDMLRAYTTDRRDLHPSVRIQWGIWTSISIIILSLILTSLLPLVGIAPVVGTGIFAVFLGIGIVWIIYRFRAWVYQIQDDSLYLERGVVTHRRTHVPYVRIQHVDTSRGPLERWLGLSTLVVYTAGSRGADVSIPGLLPEEATDLQQRVKQLAIEAEGDDAL